MGISVYSILVVIAVLFLSLVGLDLWRRTHSQPMNRKTKTRYTHKVLQKPIAATSDTGPDPLFDTIEPVVTTPPQIIDADADAEVSGIEACTEEVVVKPQTEMPKTIVVIHVMAREDQFFDGPNVLQALLSMGLRHGPMGIFHRYENRQNKQNTLFSVASAVEPGTFDMDMMGSFVTPGLTLFATLPGPTDPLAVYDLMIDTADRLAERLGGELYDGQYQPLTTEYIEECRASIGAAARQMESKQQA